MDTIGVGLIGTGYMGKCHALAWGAVRAVFGDAPVVRRVALCEVEEGLARRRADEFGFETSTTDWKALVADPTVDVVSITTPTGLHAPMAIAALEAGKHVWCEKPMAPALADAERMARGRARERQGRDPRLQLHPEPRDPLHRKAFEARRNRQGHAVPRRDGRGLHGRSGGAVLLAQRRELRPRRARRFRRPPDEPRCDPDRHAARGVRRIGQAFRRPPGRSGAARGRNVRHRDRAPAHGRRGVGNDPGQPLPPGAARAASSSRFSARAGRSFSIRSVSTRSASISPTDRRRTRG